jgi:parallel beta-helix repeat protein
MRKKILFRFIAVIAFLLPISAVSQITSFPHTEDFESFSTCSASCTATCPLSNGWTNTGIRDWITDVGGTSSFSTGPSADHTTGGSSGKYLYCETSCSGTNDWALVSPSINLTGSNDIQFTFWYHMYGAAMGNGHVDVSTDGGTTWTNDIIPAWTDNQDVWQLKVVSLGAYTGTVKVRIRLDNWTTFTSDFAVDDFLIYDLLTNDAGVSAFSNPLVPTCTFNDTVSVIVNNFGTDTLTSATINWSWNGVPQTALPWTGSIPPGGSLDIFLGTVIYVAGNNLSSWTTLPNGVIENPSGNGNDTTSIIGLQTGLSGIKTIGGTTPNYLTIADALTDLNTFGLCGPVIFDIRDGIYTETMDLISPTGMSDINTVTFRSENADPSLVTITTAGSFSSNFVVNMPTVNWYHFENLTLENTGTSYGTVVKMDGSSNNSIKGCVLTSAVSSTSTNGAIIYSNTSIDSNNVFMNNTFDGGSYGMYWFGSNSSTFEKGNVIEGNTFTNNYYRGIMVYYNEGVKIKNNIFIGNSAYGFSYAVYLYYVVGAPEITGNTIKGDAGTGWYYGVYWSQGGGNNSNHAKLSNNMIQVGWNGATSSYTGVYLSGAGYIDMYHNTVLVSSGGSGSEALYATSGGGIEVMNNILANYTSGYAFYLGNAFTVSNSDYNVLYSPSGSTGYVLGAQATLADWQTASAFDANSIDYNPNFFSDNDLHVCNDSVGNQGTPIIDITMDIDGHARSTTTPDMGADEFNGIVGSFLGNDIALCTGDSVQLIAGSPTDTILWSTGATTSSIWVSAPGSYSVTVNSACGTGADAVVVSTSALNYAGYMATSAVEFCNGDSVLMTSTQMADNYLWSNGSTNDSLWVTAGGTYTLTLTDGCGTGTEGLTVTMNTAPTAAFTETTSYFTASFTDASTSGGTTTYAWAFGDGNTSTDQNPVHVYSNSGMYNVTLVVTNDCGSTTFMDSVTIAIVGIDELIADGEVNIYPNPSNGDFTIDMQVLASSNVTIRVVNTIGAVVFESTPTIVEGVYSEAISLGNVEGGVYFVEVLANDSKLIKKLVIE